MEPIACREHDHQHCIDDAIARAEQACVANGARLTPLRLQALRLIWQSHQPLGAYTLLELMSKQSDKTMAPPTVYRALDFLLEQGLIHRLATLNAYVGCSQQLEQGHACHFVICRECQVAVELPARRIVAAIEVEASELGFAVSDHAVEVVGICPKCQLVSSAEDSHSD